MVGREDLKALPDINSSVAQKKLKNALNNRHEKADHFQRILFFSKQYISFRSKFRIKNG